MATAATDSPGPLWTFNELTGHPRGPDLDPPWDWLPAAARAFVATVARADRSYPCDLGAQAQRLGHNRATALDPRAGAGLGAGDLAVTLRAFARIARTGPTRQSLVVFCGPPPARPAVLAEERARFWAVLADLSSVDSQAWPARVPADPAEPSWQWCFAGQPWFVFALSPAYVARRSRAVGTCLTLVFQTARVFTGLGGETEAGRRAKRRIRGRLVDYDAVPPHPHLGDPQHSSTVKWRQYVLPDDQRVEPPDPCPFALRPAGSGTAASSTAGSTRHGPRTGQPGRRRDLD